MGCEVYRNRLLPINFNDVLKGAEPIFPAADDLVSYCSRHTYGTDLQSAGAVYRHHTRADGTHRHKDDNEVCALLR